jgi:hypothetical protein
MLWFSTVLLAVPALALAVPAVAAMAPPRGRRRADGAGVPPGVDVAVADLRSSDGCEIWAYSVSAHAGGRSDDR